MLVKQAAKSKANTVRKPGPDIRNPRTLKFANPTGRQDFTSLRAINEYRRIGEEVMKMLD